MTDVLKTAVVTEAKMTSVAVTAEMVGLVPFTVAYPPYRLRLFARNFRLNFDAERRRLREHCALWREVFLWQSQAVRAELDLVEWAWPIAEPVPPVDWEAESWV